MQVIIDTFAQAPAWAQAHPLTALASWTLGFALVGVLVWAIRQNS